MKKLAVLTLLCLFTACAPKVVSTPLTTEAVDRSDLDYAPFSIIEADTVDRSGMELLGQLQIKDGGLAMTCDYKAILKLARREALKMGGNGLIITEHRPPDFNSSCHRITADVVKLADPRQYEGEIPWHPRRKLTVADFRGSTEKRPFVALTASGFRYRVAGRPILPNRYTVIADTYFDTRLSYFKPTEDDSLVLAHEQIHFDITELYTRKFLERVDKQGGDLNTFFAEQERLMREIRFESQLKQDQYDTEVYADRGTQAKWAEWVKKELERYAAYTDKILTVDRRK